LHKILINAYKNVIGNMSEQFFSYMMARTSYI